MANKNRETTNISVNSSVTVLVYLPLNEGNYSNSQDIKAEIKFDFGAKKTDFIEQLDFNLQNLKTKILIASGFEALPVDINTTE